jgi:hypothetical protein
MTKPTMTSQWDPGNFKPLDMSKIPEYPRQMPPKYEKWLPRFTGNDGPRANYHMNDFWAFFQLHPISDDVEDLAMKLFSTTLHGSAREWYDDLSDASITSMNQLEGTFLEIWGIKLEDIQMLLQRLEHIKQIENETIREFQDRFVYLLYQIPRSHHPRNKCLIYLYTNALLINVEYIGVISEISDVSLTFSPGRNFLLNISRNFRNFQCVATHSLTRDIFSMCRESMEYVGQLKFLANKKRVRGFTKILNGNVKVTFSFIFHFHPFT